MDQIAFKSGAVHTNLNQLSISETLSLKIQKIKTG